MKPKTIRLPDEREETEAAEDFMSFAFVDLNGRGEGRATCQVLAKDEHGNGVYAPPSRYSVWSSWP